jgi:hypothetical protein
MSRENGLAARIESQLIFRILQPVPPESVVDIRRPGIFPKKDPAFILQGTDIPEVERQTFRVTVPPMPAALIPGISCHS